MMPAGSEATVGEGAAPGAAPGVPAKPLLGGCRSCRLLTGTGLVLAALWVYRGPRNSLKRGGPAGMATVAQITLAIAVGAWGVVILVDPVGKQLRREPPLPHPAPPPR